VEGAIGQRAEQLFGSLKRDEQRAAMRAFTRLVRVSSGSEEGADTRQRVRLNNLDETTRAVVQKFVKTRLLVTSLNEATNEETVEVAHEALIRRWERLKLRLNEDREFFLWRQRLNFHQEESKHAGRTLNGSSQREAEEWLRKRRNEISQVEKEFIAQASTFLGIIGLFLAVLWWLLMFALLFIGAKVDYLAAQLGSLMGIAFIYWGARRYFPRLQSFLIKWYVNHTPHKFWSGRKPY
ncbi:MAG TPA: hypothetical protein PKD31_16385, partial [Blastocatellia bacterium]|nr:hypothetical protein [Blastocatellia bacterium]